MLLCVDFRLIYNLQISFQRCSFLFIFKLGPGPQTVSLRAIWTIQFFNALPVFLRCLLDAISLSYRCFLIKNPSQQIQVISTITMTNTVTRIHMNINIGTSFVGVVHVFLSFVQEFRSIYEICILLKHCMGDYIYLYQKKRCTWISLHLYQTLDNNNHEAVCL